jgi:hypothetical protein
MFFVVIDSIRYIIKEAVGDTEDEKWGDVLRKALLTSVVEAFVGNAGPAYPAIGTAIETANQKAVGEDYDGFKDSIMMIPGWYNPNEKDNEYQQEQSDKKYRRDYWAKIFMGGSYYSAGDLWEVLADYKKSDVAAIGNSPAETMLGLSFIMAGAPFSGDVKEIAGAAVRDMKQKEYEAKKRSKGKSKGGTQDDFDFGNSDFENSFEDFDAGADFDMDMDIGVDQEF